MNKLLLMMLAGLLLVPSLVFAAPTIEELQAQIAEVAEQLEDMEDRIEGPERHTALDRIQWYGDFRTKADSLHYKDVIWSPGIKVDFQDFFTKAGAGMMQTDAGLGTITPNLFMLNDGSPGTFFTAGASATTPLDKMFANLYSNDPAAFGQLMTNFQGWMGNPGMDAGTGNFRMAPAPKISDINNDIFYTTRLRLSMKAKIYDNMDFSGRLTMFKNWGDSVGTNVFDSWNAFTMDGTNSGSPSGDMLRVERAYFNWKDISDTPFYLSIGRRPSTYGSPTNFRENEKRGGTPGGHLVNFNFDGITIGYHADELTGLEGSSIRFCYGQGFESEWGNGEMFNGSNTENIEDTHLGGFNIDVLSNDATLIQLTLFRAMDVNDGFKGTFAFPIEYAALFAPTMYQDMQKFPSFNFMTRYTPTTVIGDINLVGLNASHEMENGLTLFGSVAMTQLESNGEAGMFGGMGTDAVYRAKLTVDPTPNDTTDGQPSVYMAPEAAEDDATNEGYGVYVGMVVPAPMGKFGLEYNYGSQYWTPFTQAQDDAMGSKLATRGHAAEAYYIFEVNRRAFIKVGGIFYDYEYSGSGSPVGEPKKIDDIKDGTEYSLMPVVDTAWDAYASLTMKW